MKPHVAGWKERADFPAWGLHRVRVKLDTGARSAAIGVLDYSLIESVEHTEAELRLALYRNQPDRVVVVREPVVTFVMVKSSCGRLERRPVIEVDIRLGPVVKRIRATVTDRTQMMVPVLLGRTAVAPEFLIDPLRKYVLKRQPNH